MRLSLNSLQSRIVLLHLLAIAIAAVLVPLANFLVITQSTDQFEERTLRDHAATIGQFLSHTAEGWKLNLPEDLLTFYAHGFDGLSYTVVGEDNRLLFQSRQNDGAGIPPASSRPFSQYSRNGFGFYNYSLRHSIGSDTVAINVSQNTQHPDVIFDDIVSHYLGRIGWFTVAVLAILLAIDIAVIRNALAPVSRSSEIARAIDPGRPNLRLPEKDMPLELLPLIAAMNQALDRLEQGIRLQREFTADAAHELRTPLAVLRARVETMQDQQAVAKVKADIVVMSHVVDQLLEMAELEGAGITVTGKADLAAISEDVSAMLAQTAIRQGKAIALLGAERPVWVRGNSTMIFRAIRNLAENAIRHTPTGTTVELEVRPNGSVSVSDSGAGISERDRELIFRRFWRGDRNSGEGTGLGLAIVSRIADIHSGKVTVINRSEGGATFTLSFPLNY